MLCLGHLILTVWRNVWADWSPRSTRIWALGFITRSVPSENIVMWENNLLNSSLLRSISWGRSGKYYGINLCNLVFLASFMSRFLGKVMSIVCFYSSFVISLLSALFLQLQLDVAQCPVAIWHCPCHGAVPWSVLLVMTYCELNRRIEHLQTKPTLPHNFLDKFRHF